MVNRPVRCNTPPAPLPTLRTKPRIRREILHILRILLIAGWSPSFSPGAEKRNRHYQSRRSPSPAPKGNFDWWREKEADLSVSSIQHLLWPCFPCDRSKINQAAQLYWEWRNVDQILLLARPRLCFAFRGLQQHEHAFWFIVLNMDSLVKQLATLSALVSPTQAFAPSTHPLDHIQHFLM